MSHVRCQARLTRRALWLVCVAALLGRETAAQEVPPSTPRLEIALTGDSLNPPSIFPQVRTHNLLMRSPWVSLLREGLPVRLRYRLELWRSKSVWFDNLQQYVEWDVVIRWEPVLFEFSVRTFTSSGTRERRYATAEALASALGSTYRIAIQPSARGTHYYVASLTVSTLSDSDIEELERFLRGTDNEDTDRAIGDVIGRAMTRLLLRMAGLPSIRLEGRSRHFGE
ncbi:MAG: hypothetical protein HKM89_12320 [Gemmatimonadales bacterium]|nr:hypothetical protein [Gemmatimonadales bacterium]